MTPKPTQVYTAFERFWHWTQAMLIGLLALTGFEVHGSVQMLGYGQAVAVHNAASAGLLVLVLFAAFWHFTTGQWRQYLPTRTMLAAQARYYVLGIFRDEPHPTQKTVIAKLNPLQKLAYAGLKVLVLPVMGLTGVLYLFARYPQRHGWTSHPLVPVEAVAVLHTLGAYLLVAFVIGHVYLTTTGDTVVVNLKAMLTGYEPLPESEQSACTTSEPQERGVIA